MKRTSNSNSSFIRQEQEVSSLGEVVHHDTDKTLPSNCVERSSLYAFAGHAQQVQTPVSREMDQPGQRERAGEDQTCEEVAHQPHDTALNVSLDMHGTTG